MKAVISTSQGIENVKVLDVPNPQKPVGDKVHVAIKAVGINQRDIINFENYSRWNRPNPIPAVMEQVKSLQLAIRLQNGRLAIRLSPVIMQCD